MYQPHHQDMMDLESFQQGTDQLLLIKKEIQVKGRTILTIQTSKFFRHITWSQIVYMVGEYVYSVAGFAYKICKPVDIKESSWRYNNWLVCNTLVDFLHFVP